MGVLQGALLSRLGLDLFGGRLPGRNRLLLGRGGLDILKSIQESERVKVEVYDRDFPEIREVDGKLLDGAFVDRDRGAAIWRGVIQNAAPKAPKPREEIIWVPGPWRDPALLEWQRGGRFELRISEPVEFPLFVSSTRLTDRPGDVLSLDREQMTPLPPVRSNPVPPAPPSSRERIGSRIGIWADDVFRR